MSPPDILRQYPSALMAWRNLGRNRVRTALAALGIVIGVVAIASLGMAGAALQYQATENLGGLADEVTVTAGEDNPDGLTETHVRKIRQVSTDATVIPIKGDRTTVAANGEEVVAGVTGVTQASALYDAGEGEVPSRLESGAVVSSNLASELGLDVGDPVEYGGQLYRIRGVIQSSGGFGGGSNTLVLPVSALADQPTYSRVTLITDGGDAARELAAAVDARLNEREQVVSATTSAAALEQINSFLNTLNLALLGIGSISLVVASVAILNVMLMSTIERRGEIGVLRAVGIRRSEVLRMLLTEAGFLGLVGGLSGAVVSMGVGFVIFEALVGDPMAALAWSSSRYLVYGVGFALVASLLSGLYPAWKAANERPVESLRG
ncbi:MULTISPECIES: ABC transporter permease [Halobacterium]|uniref:ABC transporter permease n=1 Tax=Halobacterium TaxID=2239 RepID=UPI000B2B77DA|nr:ABC transporter permease [Halobacterium sp. CBA1132]MCG1003200.1 ABC transporter permease [Halobacterium noricense]